MLWLRKIVEREKFNPRLLGLIFHPTYFMRRGLYRNMIKNSHYLKGRLLDFGCGKKPYKDIFNVEKYIGLEIDRGKKNGRKAGNKYYNGRIFPFSDNFFDSVLSTEVFEHIFNLEQVLSEIKRVIKPGGRLLATIPFAWYEHEIPYDYARYTRFALKHLFQKAGFRVKKIYKSSNSVETIVQFIAIYIYKSLFPKNLILKRILTPVFIAPLNIIGLILSYLLPSNQDLYLTTVVLAEKPL